MATADLTAARLREVLNYDPNTGVFQWKANLRGGVKFGDQAGCVNTQGYVVIRIGGRLYRSNRLAWLYVNGSWPVNHIDHIDGNTANDRIENLRDVTHSLNMQNVTKARRNNESSGLLGVSRHGTGWRAYINCNGKRTNLGTFATPELAHAAYLHCKRRLHPANML